MQIIVKRYEHFNRSLGKYISSKKQYENELARGGFVSYEKGCQLAQEAQEKSHKSYKELSPKAQALIKSATANMRKKGKVELGSKMIYAMKEVGVSFKTPDWCPKHYREA